MIHSELSGDVLQLMSDSLVPVSPLPEPRTAAVQRRFLKAIRKKITVESGQWVRQGESGR
jgi:hypothetical protein